MEVIFEGMKHTLVWIYWWVISGIISILDFIGDFFSLFAGSPSTGEEGGTFLGSFFTDLDITRFYTMTALIAFIIMLLLAVVTIVKQDYFDKEGPRSKGPIIRNIALGFLLFIALVPLSTIVMMLFNEVFKFMYIAMSSGNQITNFSDNLINGALPSLGEGFSNVWADLFPSGEAGNGSLLNSFFNLEESSPLQGFHWHLLLVGGAFIAWNLFSMVIDLVKRVFNIIVLYITAPLEIARMVSDDGIRFKKWKDKMVAQLTSLVVIVVAFLIFNLISGVASDFSNKVEEYVIVEQVEVNPGDPLEEGGGTPEPANRNLGGAFVIIVMMGGSLAVRSATKLVSELAGGDSIIVKDRTRSIDSNTRDKSGSDKNAQTKPRVITRTITRDSTRTTTLRGGAIGGSGRTSVTEAGGGIQAPGGRSFTDRYSGINKNMAEPSPIQRPNTNLQLRTSGTTSSGANITRGTYYGSGGTGVDTEVINNSLSAGFRDAPINFGLTPPKWSPENETAIKEHGTNYVQASMNFDSSIASNSNFETLSRATDSYLDAANREKEIIKKEIGTSQKDIQPMRKNFDKAQEREYKRVNIGYQKAHNDYAKTAGRISSAIASPGTNPLEVIRLKEQADRQRQKLISAGSQAKKFYESKKGGKQ